MIQILVKTKDMITGFGIDFSGYTSRGTSLAAIEVTGATATATLLRGSAMSATRDTGDALREIVEAEASVLRRCLAVGPVAVDIPIDLQQLSDVGQAEFIWQLTSRPVDRAVGGLPPLASLIGAPVARFGAILRYAQLDDALKKNLLETYPAAILQKLGIRGGLYKTRGADKAKERAEARGALCDDLRIGGHLESDHDIDAVICAVAAVAPEDHLWKAEDYNIEVGQLPVGYRLFKKIPSRQFALVTTRRSRNG